MEELKSTTDSRTKNKNKAIDQSKVAEPKEEGPSSSPPRKSKFPLSNRQLLILTALILLIGLGIWFFLFRNSVSDFRKDPKPLNVVHQLSGDKASEIISREGGQVLLDTVELDIHTDTVMESARITLEGVSELEGLPEGASFITGVKASPEGMNFLKTAWLYFDIPTNINLSQVAAYRYSEDGKNLHFYPVLREGDQLRIPVADFSGYGLLALDADFTDEPVPTDIGDQALSVIHNLMRHYGILENPTEDAMAKLNEELTSVLAAWHKYEVLPNLNAAAQDSSLLADAIAEYLHWLGTAQLRGLDEPALAEEIKASEEIMAIALENAINHADKLCREQKDPNQVTTIMRWLIYAQILGYDEEGGFADALTKTANCGHFKIAINSSFKGADRFSTSVTGVGEGTLSIDSHSLTVKGSGKIQESNISIYGSSNCTSSGSGEVPFTIPEMRLGLGVDSGNKPSVSMLVAFEDVGHYNYTCDIGIGNNDSSGGLGMPETLWLSEFGSAHDDISVGFDAYALQDWEYIGKDGVFARKKFQRTLDYGTTEDTVIELIHDPIQPNPEQ